MKEYSNPDYKYVDLSEILESLNIMVNKKAVIDQELYVQIQIICL